MAQRIFSSTALIAALATTGCGTTGMMYQPLPQSPNGYDTMTGPRLITQDRIVTLPKGVVARGLQLEPGQATARVGEALRFSVVIKGSDNKIYNDPHLVTWSLSNAQLGQVDVNGVLTPAAAGTVKVIAQIGGVSAEATIQLEPARYAWQQVLSPTGSNLRAVKMVSRYEAWAAGEKGTMLRFINGAWHVEPSFRQPDSAIKGLGFANASIGWAVGSRAGGSVPYVSRWDGYQWTTVNIPAKDGFLNAVSVVNERDAWAVGQEGNGDALILHWDGASWKMVEAPAKGKLNDIQMLSPRSGWAVGKASGLSGAPMIIKFQDGSWSKKSLWDNRGTISLTDSQELTAIKMVSETQGYAVGVRDNLLINPRGLFLQYEPKRDGWVPGAFDASVDGLDQVPLHDIEMISGTEGWALGEVRQRDFNFERNPKSIFGNLLANNNGMLKVDTNYFSGNVSGAFYAIDLLPAGEGFVVGENGYILQRTYDWRGMNGGSGYGTTGGYGTGTSGATPVTYGPGGQAIPGSVPVNPY
jgi:hypothetical protein